MTCNLPPDPTFLEKIYLFIHHTVFHRRLLNQKRFSNFVISVGNLSAGGTGKTPLTIKLINFLGKKNVLTVLRGYKGEKSLGLVSDGKGIYFGADEVGDEAILIARNTRSTVAISRDRSLAIEKFAQSKKIVILDDAFQNPSIYHDLDIVIIDATLTPEKTRAFPNAHFRERLDALGRAHLIILSKCELVTREDIQCWRSVIGKFTSVPIFETKQRFKVNNIPLRLQISPKGITKANTTVRGKARAYEKPKSTGRPRHGAFAGIGNPSGFFGMLSQKIDLKSTKVFPDHHEYTSKDLRTLVHEAKQSNLVWLTTEKDWVKLEGLVSLEDAPYFRVVSLDVDLPASLFSIIRKKINAKGS